MGLYFMATFFFGMLCGWLWRSAEFAEGMECANKNHLHGAGHYNVYNVQGLLVMGVAAFVALGGYFCLFYVLVH